MLVCADARVSPEWIFDVGPGALFDVRSAGNTAFAEGIAWLEYAVGQLRCRDRSPSGSAAATG